MIKCEIYEEGKENEGRIGGSFSEFSFNSLPQKGDILWLIYRDDNDHTSSHQLSCVVIYVAQWVSNFVENNHGYIVVRRKDVV